MGKWSKPPVIPIRQLRLQDRIDRRNTKLQRKQAQLIVKRATQIKHRKHFYRCVGELCELYGPAVASKITNLSPSNTVYWRERLHKPKTNTHGGRRNVKWSDEERALIMTRLQQLVHDNPEKSLTWFTSQMQEMYAIDISRSSIREMIKSLGLSHGKVAVKQIAKYTTANMTYYANFLLEIITIPFEKIKCLDEVHIDPPGINQGRRAWGNCGEEKVTVSSVPLRTRCSLTLITTLTGRYPIAFSVRHGSNTALDFVEFLLELIHLKKLDKGDILVLDNAKVHYSNDTWQIIHSLTEAIGFRLLFLPTYSSELNPAELVFAHLKNYMRHNTKQPSLMMSVYEALLQVTHQNIRNWYQHCFINWQNK